MSSGRISSKLLILHKAIISFALATSKEKIGAQISDMNKKNICKRDIYTKLIPAKTNADWDVIPQDAGSGLLYQRPSHPRQTRDPWQGHM